MWSLCVTALHCVSLMPNMHTALNDGMHQRLAWPEQNKQGVPQESYMSHLELCGHTGTQTQS